ncbi:MAG: hypothetical protein B5M53_07390 [Candidatus Cloacimonas sp. 4484_209]|nr:MAG: hypothetical protein B5M53_07390 [Candidatus Cloacimonas sp. 4484_209]
MKKNYIFSIAFIMFIFFANLDAAEKIGYIDSEKIINGYKGISGLRIQFNKQVAEWEKEAQDKKVEIDKLKDELKDEKLMLSDEMKRKKEKEIEDKQKDYEDFIKRIWGEGGESEKKHEELLKPVIEKISNVLEKIGNEDGYTMIFDISKGNIVYAKSGLDLTDRVLEEINREFATVAPTTEETDFYVFQFDEISSEAQSKSLGLQIQGLLKRGLDKLPNFESVEASRVSQVMSILGLMQEEKLDDNQIKLVATRINARIVVFGKIDLTSGKITLKLRWFDFDKSSNVITKDFSIDEKEKMEKLAQEVMTYLVKKIKGE